MLAADVCSSSGCFVWLMLAVACLRLDFACIHDTTSFAVYIPVIGQDRWTDTFRFSTTENSSKPENHQG